MPDTLNAAELRRWAMRCASQAEGFNCGPHERERLLKMREGLLELADNADWLAGKSIISEPVEAA
jgi:hypothetical protein